MKFDMIGSVVSVAKMFKECGRRMTTDAYLHYNLIKEPSAQVS